MSNQLPTPSSDPNAPRRRLPFWPRRHKNQCHCRQHLMNSVRTRACSQFSYSPRAGPQLEWLLALPPQCRDHVIDCGHPIAERLHGSSHSKQVITHRTRKVHFLSWCHTVGLHGPCTPELPLKRCNWIIACYAVSLIRATRSQACGFVMRRSKAISNKLYASTLIAGCDQSRSSRRKLH